jgi:hypothetical protein
LLSFSLLRAQALLLVARELRACAASRKIRQLCASCAVWRARVPPLAARFSPSDSFATMFS